MLPNFHLDDIHYHSFNQVLFETIDYYRVDLTSFTLRLPTSFQEMLMESPRGLYLNNGIEPFMIFDGRPYYSASAVASKQEPDIFSYDDLWKHRGPVFDQQGQPVFTVIPEYSKFYTEKPNSNRSAIHLAFIYIYEYFRLLNKVSPPTTEAPDDWLREETFVKPEFLEVSYDYKEQTRIDQAFHPEDNQDLLILLSEVRNFIGKDTFSIYHLSLNGTALSIKKGNDYRIIEYYRMVFSHLDSIRDAGY